MNEIKKRLKLLTLLATLFAGNLTFSSEAVEMNQFDPLRHEDPAATKEREAQEQKQQEQEEYDRKQALKTESLTDKVKRKAKELVEGAKALRKNVSDSGLFKAPESVRRSSAEAEEAGEELTTPDEAEAAAKDFVMVDPQPAPTSVADLTTEQIEALQPSDIESYTQADIKDLTTEIANLSPATFDSLSKAQTAALTADQLIVIFMNPELASKLKIESVNPTELSKVFNFSNRGSQITDAMVDRMTKDQINTIFKNNPAHLNEYFNDNQLATMKSKVSLKDQVSKGVAKAINWFNSTKVVKWINDFANRDRSKQEASRMARSKANGTFDSAQQEEFESHMKTLSTKGKQEVANAWATARVAKIKDLENRIEKAKELPHVKQRMEVIDALRKELTTSTQAMDREMNEFAKELQKTLKPTEVIIPLEGRIIKSNRFFEIIDMSKIDPTKSIAHDYKNLTDTGFFGTKDPVVSKIGAQDLLSNYSSWVAKSVKIDPSQPIEAQLDAAIKDKTGKQWSELDPSIKVAIFTRLDADVQARYEQDITDKKTADAARDEQVLKNLQEMEAQTAKFAKDATRPARDAAILGFAPQHIETLSLDVLNDMDPATFSKLSKEQVQAFDLDQLEGLTPDRLNAIDFSLLRPITVRAMIDTMSPEKISTLTAQQLQALPRGRLSAVLAKLSVADLQTIEAAFKEAKNPFETSVTREIARQTAPVDSYKGGFDIHRIAISNGEIASAPADQISSLPTDVVRDLTVETVDILTKDGTDGTKVNEFTPEQFDVISAAPLNAMVPVLEPKTVAKLSPETMSKLTPTTLAGLTPEQTEVVTVTQTAKFRNAQNAAFSKAKEEYSTAKAQEQGGPEQEDEDEGLDLDDKSGLGGGRHRNTAKARAKGSAKKGNKR